MNIPDFSNASVLVIGDVMLDRYWHGSTSRISPEAPVPVVHVGADEERPGGAANVALNITALGGQVSLIGAVGNDADADALQGKLEQAGVSCHFQRLDGFATITKLRVLSRHQQLIRLDFENPFDEIHTDAVAELFQQHLDDADVIVFSDYGKGTLHAIQGLIQQAREAGKTILVDPKGTDFTPYQGASLITPNLSEFEAVAGHSQSDEDLVLRGERLRDELSLSALLVTLSDKGMILLETGQGALHLPTHAREVYDVTGAGDTVISVLAAALAAGRSYAEATAIANLAAGIVVGKLGTATVSVQELTRALHEMQGADSPVLDEATLCQRVADAKAAGERVVMTNGCFDILHAGHVTYLQEARGLGDRLVVAVNDDDSVRRLKGDSRPINSLEHRMHVLAALGCVDWVVPFSEDTPERLYCNVLPDVLVKGGDYQIDEIAGGKCVMDAGGEVKVLSFKDGCSTSSMIEKIIGSGS